MFCSRVLAHTTAFFFMFSFKIGCWSDASLRYHRLHPEYIHDRVSELRQEYNLRVLLCLVDIVRVLTGTWGIRPCALWFLTHAGLRRADGCTAGRPQQGPAGALQARHHQQLHHDPSLEVRRVCAVCFAPFTSALTIGVSLAWTHTDGR